MASAPVSPAPATPSVLDNWITLFKAHEKFLIIVLAAALAFHFYGTALNAWVNHDKAAQTIAEQQAAQVSQQNAAIAEQSAQLIAEMKASNAALAQAIQKRDAQTKAQQTVDQTLPLPQLGQHWVSLIGVPAADISAQPDGSMKVSDTASRATVTQLDAIPGLQADLKSEQQTAANNQSVINQQATQIASDATKSAADQKACDNEKNTLKAQNKKSFWSGFKWGIGIGIGAAVALVAEHKL